MARMFHITSYLQTLQSALVFYKFNFVFNFVFGSCLVGSVLFAVIASV